MTNVARVADLAEQIRGVSYNKEDASPTPRAGYLPVLRAGNITEDGLVFDDLVFVPSNRISEEQKVRRNDVVIAASSGSLDVVGKAARALEDYDGGFGAFCKVLRPGPEIDPSYFAHFFRTPEYRRKVSALAGGANINNLRNAHLDEMRIPLPPLLEQRRIAAILDMADALRAKRRAALAKLDILTQAMFLDMFGEPATNSKGWPVKTIAEVAVVQGGLQVTSARKSLPKEVPYLRVANVYRGSLDLSEIKTIRATDAEIARTLLVKDDLLVVEGHGNPAEIGRAALWDGSIPRCVHQNHLIRVRFERQSIEPLYACQYLNSPGGRRHLLRAGKTTSGLNTISVSDVRATPIAVPTASAQRRFAQAVAKVELALETQRAWLDKVDTLFGLLQYRAFRGEL